MPITNPQVVAFANEKVRPMANDLRRAYLRAKQIMVDYNAGDIGSLIDAAGAGELIADGSDVDGRTRITGGDIYNFATALNALIAFVENGVVAQADRTQVIAKPSVGTF